MRKRRQRYEEKQTFAKLKSWYVLGSALGLQSHSVTQAATVNISLQRSEGGAERYSRLLRPMHLRVRLLRFLHPALFDSKTCAPLLLHPITSFSGRNVSSTLPSVSLLYSCLHHTGPLNERAPHLLEAWQPAQKSWLQTTEVRQATSQVISVSYITY